jgi:hypothetical protein
MVKVNKIKVGSKVHYYPPFGPEVENGIVKEIFYTSKGTPFIRVVYNCNNDWKNYHLYTGSSTPLENLRYGWTKQKNNK